ncbi:MAG TPA: transposase, partial [Desulfomonilia bacterium]
MRRGRFGEEQIIRILKEREAGVSLQEICRKYGMCE